MSRIEMMRVMRKKYIQRAIALVLMSLMFFSSAVSVAAMSKSVCIIDGDNKVLISTMSFDTESILELAGVQLGRNDKVIRSDNAEP